MERNTTRLCFSRPFHLEIVWQTTSMLMSLVYRITLFEDSIAERGIAAAKSVGQASKHRNGHPQLGAESFFEVGSD